MHETDEEHYESGNPKRVRVYRKYFREEWLKDDKFKTWLKPNKTDNTSCFCVACNISLKCGKSDLLKHSEGAKHKKNLESIRHTKPLFSNVASTSTKRNEHESNVKTAEIKLSSFFAEHNVPFHTIDHLVPLLKEVISDSKIATDLQLHRTKATNIIKNVLAPVEVEEVIDVLRTTKFSILVDESTDISVNKFLCVLVKYFHDSDIHVKLLELLPINSTDCSAESIYNQFKSSMVVKDIPLCNIIGVACDGANVMVGQHNSFVTRLKQECPDLIVMQCICHSASLAASKACEELPRTPEELIRAVCTYISGSSKRTAQLVEIQDFLQEERKKVLKLADTRWLAMHQCVVRMLENWDALLHYFTIASFEDKLKSADWILNELKNPYTKAYFLFLKYILNFFNSFNALFQGRKPLIHELQRNSLKLCRILCQNFVKTDSLSSVENINIADPKYFLPLGSVFLGSECEQFLLEKKVSDSEFRKKCLSCYITSAKEIQKRLPLKNLLFCEMQFLNPEIALEAKGRDILPDLHLLGKQFKDLDYNALTLEWRQLPHILEEEEKSKLKEMGIVEMWNEISSLKDFQGDDFKFKNLGNLSKLVFSLPHSNAEAERVFSMVNDIKTKQKKKEQNWKQCSKFCLCCAIILLRQESKL